MNPTRTSVGDGLRGLSAPGLWANPHDLPRHIPDVTTHHHRPAIIHPVEQLVHVICGENSWKLWFERIAVTSPD